MIGWVGCHWSFALLRTCIMSVRDIDLLQTCLKMQLCVSLLISSQSDFLHSTKNPTTNKLDSSMLKSKNQVTLFVNYSCNSFYDFRSSENIIKRTGGYVSNYRIFDFIWGLYTNIPLTDIHASGPAILILYQW